MAKLPAAQVRIGKGVDPDKKPRLDFSERCVNPVCANPAVQLHHIVRRSYISGPHNAVEIDGRVHPNLAPLCAPCHLKLELNRERIVLPEPNDPKLAYEYLWIDDKGRAMRLDPYPLGPGLDASPASPSSPEVRPEREIEATERDSSDAGVHADHPLDSLQPGEDCPTCLRRVPHKKKASTPTSKTVSFRMPLEAHESYEEVIAAAAQHLGVYEQPFWKFAVVNAGLVYALQGPKDALKKEAA